MKQPNLALGLLAATLWIGASAVAAETNPTMPLIAGYGKTALVENAGERPWSAQGAFDARSRSTALGEDLQAVFLDD